jgi:hypothetical protein
MHSAAMRDEDADADADEDKDETQVTSLCLLIITCMPQGWLHKEYHPPWTMRGAMAMACFLSLKSTNNWLWTARLALTGLLCSSNLTT